MSDPRSLPCWDLICRVVDHYGDAGVSLRLARSLASDAGREVRLIADQPQVVLDLIQPPPPGDAVNGWRDRSGVLICGWEVAPRRVDVVLETFGGHLPPALLAALRADHDAGLATPVWINLEHLSAEAWVAGCHGLPSPQSGGLTRWFLFPGFTADTAGLPGPQTPPPALPAALAALIADTAHTAGDGARTVTGSVFCYHKSPLPALLEAMQHGPRAVRLLIPTGMPGRLGGRALGDQPGSVWQGDRLTLLRIPFVDQGLYDGVLAACDFNLVRGEDSFVRAQWAARPLLWAAYPQDKEAHLDKLSAWLDLCAMPPAWASLHGWLNGGLDSNSQPPTTIWHDAVAQLDAARLWASDWRERLLTLPRVEQSLATFALRHASPLESRVLLSHPGTQL
ncbi:MAG: elongation factor P maturation arginine rhamnosyltransferase EarP [Burkholderiales bacterium]|nr:elongation factor P maturation arginine rhamnosyltransferase EarP [Burkholderiales bacterium]